MIFYLALMFLSVMQILYGAHKFIFSKGAHKEEAGGCKGEIKMEDNKHRTNLIVKS